MVKRVILGRTGEEKIVDLITAINDKVSAGHTRPAGDKVLDWDEDFYWSRADGTEHSVRDIDEELQGARDAIEAAQVEFDRADQELAEAKGRLEVMETVTLPAAEARLEAADQAAQEALGQLDGKLATAQIELETTKGNITQLGTDLAAESDAREQLAQDVQGTFTELDTRLDTFGDDPALSAMRQALTDAQATATSAQAAASAADKAASAASQAALEAAGIAASKGRVIIQETEPVGEDRNAANIWIKPIPDDPTTEIEEKAITYVYLEGSNEWVPTSSDELAQAAQNALDAREAAQQATQRAETAISNAATAQSAAEAAQQTADQATTDAREAHNEAVAAAERAQALMESGESLIVNGGFEQGPLGWEPHGDRTAIVKVPDAYAGSSVLRLTPGAINTYPYCDEIQTEPGRTYRISYWIRKSGTSTGRFRFYTMARKADGTSQGAFPLTWYESSVDLVEGEWFRATTDHTVEVEGATRIKFAPHVAVSDNVYDIDEFRVVDITEALAAKREAEAAQARADAAYAEAESKATPAEVQAAASAAEEAAKTAAAADAKAKADQAKADALAGAATDAKSKADAAQAAAVAAASADAATKANKALQDALAALATARGEITSEIRASANGKNSITRSTANASGSGAVAGDAWYKVDSNGDTMAMWIWSGSAWVASKVRNEMIDTIDVNKLKVHNDLEVVGDAVIDKLWVDGLVGKAAAFQSMTVASGNLIANGDFTQGGDFWDDRFEIVPVTGVPGFDHALTYSDIRTVANANTTPAFKMIGGEDYIFECWIKADKPGSRFFFEVRNQNGTLVASQPAEVVEGGSGGSFTPYIMSSYLVPTEWTKYVVHFRAVAGSKTARVASLYFNHSNGTERGAQVWITGVNLRPKAGVVHIEDGQVSADKINAESVAGAVGEFVEAEVGNLKATEGTVGEAVIDKLWVDGLVGKSATFNKITVSGDNNLLPDFAASVEAQNFTEVGYWTNFGINQGDPSFWVKGDDRSARFIEYEFPMEKGVRYSFEVQVRATVRGSMFYWQLSDMATGGYIGLIDPDGLASTTYPFHGVTTSNQSSFVTTYRSSGISDTTTARAKLRIFPNHTSGANNSAGYMWFTGARIRPMVGTTLIEPGAITTEKLTVTEAMTAKFAKFTSAETKKLYVTEELVAQAVNIPGKMLIGKDRATSVFTGKVAFDNIEVTGDVLADKISGEHLYGTIVEGGEIVTTNAGAGQVILSDGGYVDSGSRTEYPGIRILPPDTSELVTPPGMGPNENGFVITGGRNLTGGRAFSIYSPNSGEMSFVKGKARSNVTVRDGISRINAGDANGNFGSIETAPGHAKVGTVAADGSAGIIQAVSSAAIVATLAPNGDTMSQIRSNGREAYMWSVGSDGLGRILSVDSNGVWVKMQRDDSSGLWDHYNLNPQRNSNPFPMPSGWVPDGSANEARYTITLGMCYWGGILKYSGTLPKGWSTLGYAPVKARPREGDQTRALPTSSGRTVLGKIHMNGLIQIWLDQAASGIFMHFAPFTYLV